MIDIKIPGEAKELEYRPQLAEFDLDRWQHLLHQISIKEGKDRCECESVYRNYWWEVNMRNFPLDGFYFCVAEATIFFENGDDEVEEIGKDIKKPLEE